ncbi:hypothetical protein SKAU_G00269340 [Synaphobranchus kaupii]|uniref:Uncharacterized protein n=1 Tax=Synaphobranchus kaupii TaxID=118154 RepID=A0A9Q1IPI3_SYNKA|nr:hypothetical protein SKAU_G00269340 [Synaphobranchus kaupii]
MKPGRSLDRVSSAGFTFHQVQELKRGFQHRSGWEEMSQGKRAVLKETSVDPDEGVVCVASTAEIPEIGPGSSVTGRFTSARLTPEAFVRGLHVHDVTGQMADAGTASDVDPLVIIADVRRKMEKEKAHIPILRVLVQHRFLTNEDVLPTVHRKDSARNSQCLEHIW